MGNSPQYGSFNDNTTIDKYVSSTHFDRSEIILLCSLFESHAQVDKKSRKTYWLNASSFTNAMIELNANRTNISLLKNIPVDEMASLELFLLIVFRSLSGGSLDKVVSMDDVTSGLSIYCKGNDTEILNFYFSQLDQQNRGYITTEDLLASIQQNMNFVGGTRVKSYIVEHSLHSAKKMITSLGRTITSSLEERLVATVDAKVNAALHTLGEKHKEHLVALANSPSLKSKDKIQRTEYLELAKKSELLLSMINPAHTPVKMLLQASAGNPTMVSAVSKSSLKVSNDLLKREAT